MIRSSYDDGSIVERPWPDDDPVGAYLEGLAPDGLRSLVHELITLAPAAARFVEARAVSSTPGALDFERAVTSSQPDDVSPAALLLLGLVDEAIADVDLDDELPDWDDWPGSEIDLDPVLHELEAHVRSGTADLALPALRHLLAELVDLLEDDWHDRYGAMSDACGEAVALYATACATARPDPVELGRWLAEFRSSAPCEVSVTVGPFAAALGEPGLSAYRAALDRFENESWHTTALVELADLDGDVDRAVELLTQLGPDHAGIFRRLAGVGRFDEALVWADRATAAGHVRLGSTGGQWLGAAGGQWLGSDEVAEAYVAADRGTDALAHLRRTFTSRPGWAAYELLGSFADRFGVGHVHREWARDESARLAQKSGGTGAALIEITLGLGDADAAWAAADAYGAGPMLDRLAEQTEQTHPMRAAEVYRRQVEGALRRPSSKAYPGIAATLVRVGRLFAAGEASEQFEQLVRELRERYRNRPAMRRAFDSAGLPA